MSGLESAHAANRAAVNELIGAAESAEATWTTPRAPGKWSPSQVVEHVARALEESANVVSGRPSRFPSFPGFLRPVVRTVFFNRVLKTGRFPKARTNKAMDPAAGPLTPADGRVRLLAALAQYERECNALPNGDGTIESKIFGLVSIQDYTRFQELHTRHHLKQMRPES
jgi:hypothetical protein